MSDDVRKNDLEVLSASWPRRSQSLPCPECSTVSLGCASVLRGEDGPEWPGDDLVYALYRCVLARPLASRLIHCTSVASSHLSSAGWLDVFCRVRSGIRNSGFRWESDSDPGQVGSGSGTPDSGTTVRGQWSRGTLIQWSLDRSSRSLPGYSLASGNHPETPGGSKGPLSGAGRRTPRYLAQRTWPNLKVDVPGPVPRGPTVSGALNGGSV